MTDTDLSISVYYMKHQSIAGNPAQIAGLPLLPRYIRQYEECKRPEAAMRPLASALLLYQVLGISEDHQLVHGVNGKPFCAGNSAYFSLSHDDGLTILSTASFVHGIDLEKITGPRLNVAEKVFPECYLKELEGDPSGDTFTRLWTRTEAILKAEGTGFTFSLKEHPDLLLKWRTKSMLLGNFHLSAAAETDFRLLPPVEISFPV